MGDLNGIIDKWADDAVRDLGESSWREVQPNCMMLIPGLRFSFVVRLPLVTLTPIKFVFMLTAYNGQRAVTLWPPH